MITFPAPWKWQLAVAGSLVLAAASACKDDQDGPQPVDPDAPQSYGHCGDALTDCMPAPESFGGCSEFYSEYDLLEMKPIGPWWTVCVPECAADSDCPIPNTGSAGPKCRIDGDIGSWYSFDKPRRDAMLGEE